MTAEWHDLLACPVCAAPLREAAGTLRCPAGHSFDVARQGYVNLLTGDASPGTGDTAAMVDARADFLGRGHFEPLIEAVAHAVAEAAGTTPGCLIEVGAGTGEYLARSLDLLPGRTGLALDISKYAARRAVRAHARAGAVVCDAWRALPVRDSVAAVVMSVFAPRNPAEFARVLVPGGALVVVTPTPRHLGTLVEALGLVGIEEAKDERLERTVAPYFAHAGNRLVECALVLDRADALAVAAMGRARSTVRRRSYLPEWQLLRSRSARCCPRTSPPGVERSDRRGLRQRPSPDDWRRSADESDRL